MQGNKEEVITQSESLKNERWFEPSSLDLKWKNGNWLRVPVDTLVDEVGNSFEHYLKEYGYYSIRTQWFEGNSFKLVNDVSGEITNLFGRPYFSPNGNFVISINLDLEAQYSANGF